MNDDNVRATLFRYWLVLDFLCYVTVTCHDFRPFRFAVFKSFFDPSTENRLDGTWLVWNVKLRKIWAPNFSDPYLGTRVSSPLAPKKRWNFDSFLFYFFL